MLPFGNPHWKYVCKITRENLALQARGSLA
jgi:hypothetical protein